jgi:hypothetical protein
VKALRNAGRFLVFRRVAIHCRRWLAQNPQVCEPLLKVCEPLLKASASDLQRQA